jgi:hypothetical protein
MADARLELRINRVLFTELRQVASELGSLSISQLAEDIVESWAAERRLPQCRDPHDSAYKD